jgi:acetyl-CoA synthetase
MRYLVTLSVNWSLPFNEKIQVAEGIKSLTLEAFRQLHESSIKEPATFWAKVGSELDWFRKWDTPLDNSNPPFYKWFAGGELNASYLCVDRHAKSWRRNKVAFYWEGEPWEKSGPKDRRTLTYADLYREVNRVAYLLRSRYGIQRGDVIGIYLPMIPELPILMLAAARIGAAFTVVFSGFSSDALADRFNDSNVKLVVTADSGWRRGAVTPLKPVVDTALAHVKSVRHVLVVRRSGLNVEMHSGRDDWWDEALSHVSSGVNVEPEKMKSEDTLYILYTSGTTGKPKGQVHDTGGYLTLLHATMGWVFDARDEDVYWCAADIGWVTGHSYIVFGPLLEGVTSVMYEGAPDYPSPDRWASIIERYGVTLYYTSPTAIRSFMKLGDEWVKRHDLSSVRLMHSVGEPINPAAYRWFSSLVGKPRIPFGSTWWMTETGGIMISHVPGLGMIPMKPGTNGMPIPGIKAEVFDEQGRPQKLGERGYLVIEDPWPGMPVTIYKDPERFKQVYFSRFKGAFYSGDYAVRDEDGYFWVLGRSDEVIKVAGHRLGTYELESTLVQHPAVAEAAVVGRRDEVKGEVPVAFVILRQGKAPSEELRRELNLWVREKVGPVAALSAVYFVSKLPKTRSAKIMRRVVSAVVSDRDVGDTTTLEDGASVDEVKRAYAELAEEVKGSRVRSAT